MKMKRFLKRVNSISPDHCWNWIGKFDGEKPRFWYDGKNRYAQAAAYEIYTGKNLAANERVYRICKNKNCVNPKHLEIKVIKI